MDSEHDTGETDLATESDAANRPMGPGEKLRAARLDKGWDLSFIAAETRIAKHHLEALENEDFDHMASRAYAIGFARNYARAVGLDETEITDAVRAEMADESERRAAMVGGMQPGDPEKLPSAGLAWFGAFAAILLAAGVYAFYNTYYASGPGLGSLLADEEADGEDDAQAAASEQDNAISADGQVVFTAMDDEIWVRFFVEGGDILYEATMQRGDRYEVPKSIPNVRLNTGRPQFLQITIDGQEVPKLAEEQVTLVEPVSAASLIARFAPVSEVTNTPASSVQPVSRPTSASTAAVASPAPIASPSEGPAPASNDVVQSVAGPGSGSGQSESVAEPVETASTSAPDLVPAETTAPAAETQPNADEAPPAG